MNGFAEVKMRYKLLSVTLASIIVVASFIPMITECAANNDKIPLTVQIFTPQGQTIVNKEIAVKEVKGLTAPQSSQEWIKKLHDYGLLGGLSISEAYSLLDRDSQQWHSKSIPVDGLVNVFCSVNVTAGSCMMVPVFPYGFMSHLLEGMNYLLSLGIPPFLLFPLWILMYALYIPFIPIDFVSKFVGMYVPVKPPLFRGFLIGNDLHFKTTGLLGTLETYGNYTTVFRMKGFTGIWLSDPITHRSWIRGFALAVSQWQ